MDVPAQDARINEAKAAIIFMLLAGEKIDFLFSHETEKEETGTESSENYRRVGCEESAHNGVQC